MLKPERIFVALILILAFVFTLWPQLDVAVSSAFFDGTAFFMSKDPLWRTVRKAGFYLPLVLSVGLVACLLEKIARPYTLPRYSVRKSLYLLTMLIIGPGLIVNLILKENWGRARPRNTELFGGDLPFSSALEPVAHCVSNCSFVSGEAATAFWFTGFAVLAAKNRQKPMFWFLNALAAGLSFLRIGFGGHYASDVIFAWLIMAAVMWGGFKLFFKSPAMAPFVNEYILQRQMIRFGLWLKKALWRQEPIRQRLPYSETIYQTGGKTLQKIQSQR